MSIKRMVTKLALAFAAKKGVEAFHNVGGLQGLQAALQGKGAGTDARGGMMGRVGGTRAADSGGLGSILDSLGYGGASDGREAGYAGQVSPLNASLGTLFGTLATAFGGSTAQSQAAQSLDDQFDMTDIDSESEAKPIMRAMVQMARSDGHIDQEEQDALFNILDDASPREQAALKDALREPINPQAIADDTPSYARKEVYSAALLVGAPDNPEEKKFLKALAAALRLRDDDVDGLHRAIGKPTFA